MQVQSLLCLKSSWKKKRTIGWIFRICYQPVPGSNIMWVGQYKTKKNKKKSASGCLPFLWEEWHLKQRAQLWAASDRQTDGGQILPARQINCPHRVGSPWDDSFIHVQGNMSAHTYTHTERERGEKYTVFATFSKHYICKAKLQKKMQPSKTVSTRWMKMKEEINLSAPLTRFSPSSCFCLRLRWKCSWWDCLSGRLSLVTDSPCVGGLCFHLPFGQPARH